MFVRILRGRDFLLRLGSRVCVAVVFLIICGMRSVGCWFAVVVVIDGMLRDGGDCGSNSSINRRAENKQEKKNNELVQFSGVVIYECGSTKGGQRD